MIEKRIEAKFQSGRKKEKRRIGEEVSRFQEKEKIFMNLVRI